jgi:excisionase family DNA binding protein
MPRAAVARAAESEPRWADLGEAATYSHLSRKTLRRWIDEGLLPATRLGPKIIRIDLNDLDRLRRRIPAVAAQLAAVDVDAQS